MTKGLQADLTDHNLCESSFIVSANPYNVRDCQAPDVREASRRQGLWYDGECYGAAVANDIYKFFINEDDSLTPLGAHAQSLELPLPTFGIDRPPVGVVTKTLEEWQKVEGEQPNEVNQVMRNIAHFKEDFQRHQASLQSLSKPMMMSTWTARLAELHQEYNQHALYTGFEQDNIIPFWPMQVNDFTWSHTHLAGRTVLRVFGANTPELVQQVLELSFDLNAKLKEPNKNKYAFVERLSKFITMLKPTGCFTDVANFAYYVADHPRQRRPEEVDIKIPITQIADALEALKTNYLEPLGAINQHIDSYNSITNSRSQNAIDQPRICRDHLCKQERDLIMRTTECFPHKLYHDSERDDICVLAMMSYANKTLRRLLDSGLIINDTELERKVVEYIACVGRRPIVVQLAPAASLTSEAEWMQRVLKKCSLDEAREKLAAIKRIYQRCGVRVLEDPDTTNFAQVIDASWDFTPSA